jgi:hypothetical protein
MACLQRGEPLSLKALRGAMLGRFWGGRGLPRAARGGPCIPKRAHAQGGMQIGPPRLLVLRSSSLNVLPAWHAMGNALASS